MLRTNTQKVIKEFSADRQNLGVYELALTYIPLAAAIWAIATYPGWPTYCIAFVVIGVMQHRIVLSCHEAVHKSLLYPLWLNELVGVIHCGAVGMNFARYREQHFAHHRATHVADDSDGYIYEPILRAAPGWRRFTTWVLGTIPEVFEKVRQKGFGGSQVKSTQARNHSIIMVLMHVSIALCFATFLDWWHYFAFWLLPLSIAIFLNRTRVWVEHGFPVDNAHLVDDFSEVPQETIDIKSNFLERYVFAAFAFNFHYTHHRFPTVPFYHNHDVATALENEEQMKRAQVNSSYLGLIARMLRA